MNITVNSTAWPVDPKFNPVCGLDQAGKPAALQLGSTGALKATVEGAATEETLSTMLARTLGLNGAKYVTGSGSNTDGPWYAIQALEDTVFSSITASDWSGAAASAVPLPAGSRIFGQFTAFTLGSGKVLAFNTHA